jgi:hypothetical protein
MGQYATVIVSHAAAPKAIESLVPESSNSDGARYTAHIPATAPASSQEEWCSWLKALRAIIFQIVADSYPRTLTL